jgi:uncharacterized protein (TIGR00255 family)
VKESQRIEQRLRGVPEGLEHGLAGDLRRTRAVGVTAHAIRDQEQRRLLCHRSGHAVLVLLAPAQEAHVGVFNPQEEIPASVRLRSAFIAPGRARSVAFPMIASMTGFARREISGSWGTLVCELRSVNHRFLEAGFRLPDELRSAEAELRQRLAREVRRGKVDCVLTYRRAQVSEAGLEVDSQALERLLARLKDIGRSFPEHTVNLLDLLRWPGILKEDTSAGEELLIAAQALFGSTVDDLVAARAREGLRLKEILELRCASLEEQVRAVRARLPEVQTRLRARLDERLRELTASTVDQERLEQELALLLQRLDIDEELDRLCGHIHEIRRVLAANEPAGRRLDFLMQELNREANTLSSKSQDLDTTRSAVDMKVIIEQMREQVQNAE